MREIGLHEGISSRPALLACCNPVCRGAVLSPVSTLKAGVCTHEVTNLCHGWRYTLFSFVLRRCSSKGDKFARVNKAFGRGILMSAFLRWTVNTVLIWKLDRHFFLFSTAGQVCVCQLRLYRSSTSSNVIG